MAAPVDAPHPAWLVPIGVCECLRNDEPMRVTFASIVSNTGLSVPGELEMTCSTSERSCAPPDSNSCSKTAKTLGLTVPDKLLALADGVIEERSLFGRVG